MSKGRVLMAMSGGIDSTMASLLLETNKMTLSNRVSLYKACFFFPINEHPINWGGTFVMWQKGGV